MRVERKRIALVRPVSASIAQCELTHLERQPIDLARARAQHREYAVALAEQGCEVIELPALDECPDAVFVEDAAVVLDEVAVLTRPGALSRRAEVDSLAPVVARHRHTLRLAAPATLDGGDVLRLDRQIFVGRTPRTNEHGIAQLGELLAPFGYQVRAVAVDGCLHLKTAISQVAPRTLLLHRAWIATDPEETFAGFALVDVDPAEPMAANALLLGDSVLYPRAFPRTAARLRALGLRLVEVDADELGKAEGGVTCCSLILEPRVP